MKQQDKLPKFMWEKNIFKSCLDKWGADSQINMMQEEAAELIHSLNKFRRGRIGKDEVIKELADVQVVLEQMLLIFGETEFQLQYDKNLKNLEERLK